jgi:hypothetical protein
LNKLQIGQRYAIEIEEREFNGRVFRKITDAQPFRNGGSFAEPPVRTGGSTSEPPPRGGGHNVTAAEQAFVASIVGAFVAAGRVDLDRGQLEQRHSRSRSGDQRRSRSPEERNSVVRLAVTNPEKLLEILSHEEMAAQEFEPVPQLRGQKAKTFEELRKHQQRLDDFCVSVRMALSVLGQTKAELIEGLSEMSKADGGGGFDARKGSSSHLPPVPSRRRPCCIFYEAPSSASP